MSGLLFLLWDVTYFFLFFFFFLQNAMNLPPDKARLLRQYDNEKKWELICDQVRNTDAFWTHREENQIYTLNISDFFQEIHGFLFCDLPSCFSWPKKKLEKDILVLHYLNSLFLNDFHVKFLINLVKWSNQM